VTLPLLIRPRAIVDIDDLSLFLALSSTRVALRFQKSVQQSMERIAKRPDLGALYDSDLPHLRALRFWAVRGFPNHLICYRQTGDGIEVVRVLHGARNIPDALHG
jgi:toxin ParE1/3/4